MKNNMRLAAILTSVCLVSASLETTAIPVLAAEADSSYTESVDVFALSEEAQDQDASSEETTVVYETVEIGSLTEFAELVENCHLDSWSADKYVVLTADLDFSGQEFEPIEIFGGLFDGQGHTLSGVSVTGYADETGVFGVISEEGIVANLNVEGTIAPTGYQDVLGGIAGINNGTISNCTFSGDITADSEAGGIAARNGESGIIIGCSTFGSILASSGCGGIVGYNEGTISSCENSMEVNTAYQDTTTSLDEISETLDTIMQSGSLLNTGELSSDSDIGGIAGFSSGVILSCVNYGTVGYEHVGYNVGGIVGRSSGYLSDCTNYAQIYGRKDVGGIAGQMQPYLNVSFTEETLAELETELDVLGDLVQDLLDDADGMSTTMSNHVTNITGLIDIAVDSVANLAEEGADAWDDASEQLNDAGDKIRTALYIFSAVGDSLDEYLDGITDSVDDVGSEISSYINSIISAVETLVDDLEAAVPTESLESLESLISEYSSSGSVDYEALLSELQEKMESLKEAAEAADTGTGSDSSEDGTLLTDGDSSGDETLEESEDGTAAENETQDGSEDGTATEDETQEESGDDTATGSDSQTQDSETTGEEEAQGETEESTGTADGNATAVPDDGSTGGDSGNETEATADTSQEAITEETGSGALQQQTPGGAESDSAAQEAADNSGSDDAGTSETALSDEMIILQQDVSYYTVAADVSEGTVTEGESGVSAAAVDAQDDTGDDTTSSETGDSVASSEETEGDGGSSDTSDGTDDADDTGEDAVAGLQDYADVMDEVRDSITQALTVVSETENAGEEELSGLLSSGELESSLSGLETNLSSLEESLSSALDAVSTFADSSTDLSDLESSLTSAVDALSDSPDVLSSLSTAMQVLASIDLQLNGVSGETRANAEVLYNAISQMMDEVDALGGDSSDSMSSLHADLTAVVNQFDKVLDVLVDSVETMIGSSSEDDEDAEDLMEDVSDEESGDSEESGSAPSDAGEDDDGTMRGRAAGCVNYGNVDADINVGGIVGMTGVEYGLDSETDIEISGSATLNYIFQAKCIVEECTNRGDITTRSNYAGGIAGRMEMGLVSSSANYGNLDCSGNYIGGVAGYCAGTLRGNIARCDISGGRYVGGVAGYAVTMYDNLSMVNILDYEQYAGAIAGSSGEVSEEEISGNYYYSTSLYGIDNVSYEGLAEGISYADFLAMDAVPEDFADLVLTFVSEDGDALGVVTCGYGESVDDALLPDIPEKEGFYGVWSRTDYSSITADETITAEYIRYVTLLASEEIRESGIAAVEVDGQFTAEAQLEMAAQSVQDNELERWSLIIPDDGASSHQIRYVLPDGADDTVVHIYLIAEDGTKTEVETTSFSGYLLFEAEGSEVTFAVDNILSESGQRKVILILSATAAAAAAILLILLIRRSKKKRAQ